MSYKVFGRRARYVNADLLATEQTVVSDVFRNVIGKFFIVNDKNQIVYDENEEEIEEFYSLVQKDEETQEEYLYLRATDPNSEELDSFNQDLASLIQTDQSFEDLHHIKNLPISKTILEGMNVVGAVSNIDIEPTYNFYVKPYENYINKTYDYLPENVLPNFYALYAQSVYGQESFEPLNTLEDNFKKEIGEEFLTSFTKEKQTLLNRYRKYFTQYSQEANKVSSITDTTRIQEAGNTVFGRLNADFKTYVFDNSTIPLFTTEYSKGEAFPMYNEIAFSTDMKIARGGESFSGILAKYGLERQFILRTALSEKIALGGAETSTRRFGKGVLEFIPSPSSGVPPQQADTYGSLNYRIWKIGDVIDSLFDYSDDIESSAPAEFVGTTANISDEQKATLFTKFDIFEQETSVFFNTNVRNMEQLLAGHPAYSETVFYKIEKYLKSSNLPITTYYIPDSNSMDMCHFVDTQVKYGRNYRYKITSYNLVVGTQYSYQELRPLAPGEVKVTMDLQPSVYLVETPYDSADNVSVIDAPPIPPDLSVVPFRGKNNKLLLNLNASTGEMTVLPEIINPEDQAKIDEQRQNQRRPDLKVEFAADDAPASFQVYRLDKRPKSYLDFADSLIKQVNTNELSYAGSFVDNIVPNQKYYYTARTVDVHGNLSNPTTVFEVEMISKKGMPYLEFDTIDLQEEYVSQQEKSLMKKPMRRYIQIIPTVPQGLLNVPLSNLPLKNNREEDTANGVQSVVLGVSDEKLWGKKFRFRFTSKKTGRKIELDVNFTTEHQLNES